MIDLLPAFNRIDRFAQRQMELDAIPCLAVAVTDREELLHLGVHGFANLETREQLTSESLFAVGSIGKSMTAIALLRQQEEGAINLDDPVAEYLSWFDVQTGYHPITLHHLLTHTAGIIAGTDGSPDGRHEVWSLRDSETAWSPGRSFYNSDVGYKALGLILEEIEEKTYGNVIRERIFDRLGMRDSEPIITQDTYARMAQGYEDEYDDRPWLPHYRRIPAPLIETNTGDGSSAMTPADLATYLRCLLNYGEGLISEDSFQRLTGKYALREAGRWGGYGLWIDDRDGRTLIAHGGNVPGYFAYVIGDLEAGIGAAVMINCPGGAYTVADFALRAARAALDGDPLPDVPDDNPWLVENAEKYRGDYHRFPISNEMAFELFARGERLFMRYAGGEVPLYPHWQDSAFIADHPDFSRVLLWFAYDPDRGTRISHGSDTYYGGVDVHGHQSLVIWDVTPPQPTDERGQLAGHYRSHNPWNSNFRVIGDWSGDLRLVWPWGDEEELYRMDANRWRVADTPEIIRFDTFVDGQALRAIYSGCPYYRFFTD